MAQSRYSSRIRYLLRSAAGSFQAARHTCPECGSRRRERIRTKLLVTQLNRCTDCRLLFRTPTDPPHAARRFYQREYRSGFTTACPTDSQLQRWLAERFAGTDKDFSERIEILKALGVVPGRHRILDFGCSWGYGTWQLQQAGFETVGVEISQPRAAYGREHLGLSIYPSTADLPGHFDVFFSAHVIEHLSAPSVAVRAARQLLRRNGLFIAFTPNGCEERRQHDPASYHRSWGAVHPSYLDRQYWEHVFVGCPKFITSSPYDLAALSAWNGEGDLTLHLHGAELMAAVRLSDGGGERA